VPSAEQFLPSRPKSDAPSQVPQAVWRTVSTPARKLTRNPSNTLAAASPALIAVNLASAAIFQHRPRQRHACATDFALAVGWNFVFGGPGAGIG
jgi:hypothetical protein